MRTPRLIIGKHQMSGMMSLACDDLFGTTDGKLWVLTSGSYGWSLRELNQSGDADYLKPPLDGFTELDHSGFIHAVNSRLE